MKITKETIDELLFEYFEGNLRDQEKTELMNFIHQNPEFNDDFTSWAQSYAHAHEQLEDYKIAGKLRREEGSSIQLTGKAAALAVLFFLSATLLLWYVSSTRENYSEKGSKTETSNKTTDLLPKASLISPADSGSISVAETVRKKGPVVSQRSEKDSLRTNHLRTVQKDDREPQENFSGIPSSTDTTVTTVSITEPLAIDSAKKEGKASVKEKEPKRRKRKINLKPTPEFLPAIKDL